MSEQFVLRGGDNSGVAHGSSRMATSAMKETAKQRQANPVERTRWIASSNE